MRLTTTNLNTITSRECLVPRSPTVQAEAGSCLLPVRWPLYDLTSLLKMDRRKLSWVPYSLIILGYPCVAYSVWREGRRWWNMSSPSRLFSIIDLYAYFSEFDCATYLTQYIGRQCLKVSQQSQVCEFLREFSRENYNVQSFLFRVAIICWLVSR